MANPNAHIASLYSELLRAGDSGEFDKALKVVNKILHEDKEDKKAHQCKAVCLIHLSEFAEALKILDKHASDSHFERAYCFYRLNRISEAYDTLKSIGNQGWKEKELLAQVLYRLEKYDECFDVYKELIKNSEDDFEEERETNLAAVVSNLYSEKGKDFKKAPQLREHTYELCYNSACILINRGEYKAAIEKLKMAEELCKKTLEENDATEEEIKAIYQAKTEEFNKCPKAERMPGALEVLTKIKSEGLTPMVVTGSGQTSLLDRLNHNFPGIFQANLMVTAFDVKYGKPNPEPYLMALKKGGFKPNEALVIENAPLGVQAGVAAGIFTIAVNTGPLHDNVLLNEGANLLFHSMPDFNKNWETLQSALKQD